MSNVSFLDVANNRYLVTGASEGIGKATAVLLNQLGAEVILVARDQTKLNRVGDILNPSVTYGLESFDLSQVDDIPVWMKKLSEKYGMFAGVVHAAGLHLAKPLKMVSANDLEKVMRLNVYAAIALAKGFRLPAVHKKPGSMVLLSSVVGFLGQAGILPYALSKGGIIAAIKSLAVELAPEQIRVNGVAPGIVKTTMTENLFTKMADEQVEAIKNQHLLGFGEPIDVAWAILYLLSPVSKWTTGACLNIDGGYSAF